MKFIIRNLASSILIVVGLGIIYLGYTSDPIAMTDDGLSLKNFYYSLGGFFVGISVLTTAIIYFFVHSKQKRLKHLMEKGVKGKAKILAVEDTGVLINNMPRLKVTLQINLSGFEVYELAKNLTVPHSVLPKIQIENEIDVMVDPNDHKNPEMVGLLIK